MSILTIIGIILVIIILASMIAWYIGIARSRDCKTITPEGAIIGKALIAYDPGLSGGTRTVAFYMAEDLKLRGYEVKIAGVRSQDALETSGYDIIIIGSPTYGGTPTEPVVSYLSLLEPPENVKIGVYSLAGSIKDDSNLVMAQILKDKSIPAKLSTKYGHSAFGAGDKNKYSKFIPKILG